MTDVVVPVADPGPTDSGGHPGPIPAPSAPSAPTVPVDAARSALADGGPDWSAVRWVGRVIGLFLVFSLVVRALAGQPWHEIAVAVAPIVAIGVVLALVVHLVERGRSGRPVALVAVTVVDVQDAGRDVDLTVSLPDGGTARWRAAADRSWLPVGEPVWCTPVRDGELVRAVVCVDDEMLVAEPATAAQVSAA